MLLAQERERKKVPISFLLADISKQPISLVEKLWITSDVIFVVSMSFFERNISYQWMRENHSKQISGNVLKISACLKLSDVHDHEHSSQPVKNTQRSNRIYHSIDFIRVESEVLELAERVLVLDLAA